MRTKALFGLGLVVIATFPFHAIATEEVMLAPDLVQMEVISADINKKPVPPGESFYVGAKTIIDSSPSKSFTAAKVKRGPSDSSRYLVGYASKNVLSTDTFRVRTVMSTGSEMIVTLDLMRPFSPDGEPGPGVLYYIVDAHPVRMTARTVRFKIINWDLQDGRLTPLANGAVSNIEVSLPLK